MMKWTEKQWEAISLRDKNILVSAAAGSGKTAVLVERIKGLLLEDQEELTGMLIVTFSNAAASEMKEKIVKALNGELLQSSGDEKKQKFLRCQLNSIHRCNISTFHAFAMEVIRRYFHLIDVEPDFKICDEGQKTILQAEALEEIFSQGFENGDEGFLRFLDLYGTGKSENDVKDMILKVHGFIQSLPQPYAWLEEKTSALSAAPEEFAESVAFRQMCGEIADGLALAFFYFSEAEQMLEEGGVLSLLPKVRMDLALVEAAAAALSGKAEPEEPATVAQDDSLKRRFSAVGSYLRGERGTFQRFIASKADKEAFEEIKEDVAAVRNKGRDIFKKLNEQYGLKTLEEYAAEMAATAEPAAQLCTLVKVFDAAFRARKDAKKLLDFSDIEHFALDILAHPQAAAEYRDKFHYIFIDEYQDSNLVQETLISRISRENNVFMVGDVKQSIYKFRLAEPELFIGKYQRFSRSETGCDAKVDLNRNFRSKGNIIKAINQVFSKVMSAESTGMDYDEDAALYKGVDYEGELDYPISLHLVDDKAVDSGVVDEEIQDMKKAELEAYAAARLIRQVRGKSIYDAKKGAVRPLENRDIVILLRGVKGYGDLYYKALSEEGIPAFMDNSDGYFDTVEIQIFLNLLQVIDNGRQDLPLLSVLRSPLFDFSIDELAEIRLSRPKGAYYEAFVDYGQRGEKDLREKCCHASDRLTRYRRRAAYTPLSDFLSMLVRETGYGDFIAAIPSGQQRQANLRALVDKAIEYEASQSKGLYGFIRYIEALKKQKISIGQVKLAGENDDVVRIMTVHKSKGLEFPFVLTAGLGRRFNIRQDMVKVSFHKDLGIALRLIDPEQGYYKKTLLQTLIEQKKRREDMAEEIRTLYVAFTRAMDELVLMGTVSDMDKSMKEYQRQSRKDVLSARCYLDLIVPVLLENRTELFCHDRSEYSVEKKLDTVEKERLKRQLADGFRLNLPPEEGARLWDEIGRRLSYTYPAAGEEKKSKYSVSELANDGREQEESYGTAKQEKAAMQDFPAVCGGAAAPRFVEPVRTMTAAQRGTVIHKVMEHIPFTAENKSPDMIGEFVRSLVERELLTVEEAEAVDCRVISAFFSSEIGLRACRAAELHREISFNMRKELDGGTVIVQGTIDCYFREGDHYVLLDYKSNYVNPAGEEKAVETIVNHYRPQTALYREALEKIRGISVPEVYLYLFSLGKEMRVE